MTIPFVGSTPPPTTTSTSNNTMSKSQVDYQSFLKLLVAQMKNQDPTAPMESTDYVAQLATFSGVEQQIQINTKLDQMLQANALSQADAIIGRHITSADGKTSGIVEEVKIKSDKTIAVLENGKEVTIEPGITIRAEEPDNA
ncbi:MAG TPA: flagellar hook assembly protein FlgD [Rhizobiaceae bacterium]|nr:flagellar hook assembly protein FlgD [Rhizobiaceae bacterium]